MLQINNFLKLVKLKKQYLKKLKEKSHLLKTKKENYKKFSYSLKSQNKSFNANSFILMYVISIVFSRSNSLLHIMDFSGKLKFFYSAGSFDYSGKSKKARLVVFKKFYRLLVSKLSFLKNKPIGLHLTNVGLNKTWIVKRLKKRFFIIVIRNFNSYPHNGCRKRKVRRKKVRKLKGWLSGLRRQTVNLLSLSSQVRILLLSV